jgi:SAM-dependent methyltransferase
VSGNSESRDSANLLLASAATLYFELLTIRYLCTEVRVFTNLKNLPLIASFFGIGLGMILGEPRRKLATVFPFAGLLFFSVIRYAAWLRLPNTDVSWTYDLAQNPALGSAARVLYALRFIGLVFTLSSLVVVLFVVLGGFVGEPLKRLPSLKGYGINLAGSLAGVLLFSALAFFNFGPSVWLLVGFLLLVPFFPRRIPVILFLLTIAAVAVPQPNVLWSPYYRIDFVPLPPPPGANKIAACSVVTNHVWYQWLADLSPEFLRQYPNAEPNRFLAPYYDLPYRLVSHPRNVLILGAGTGNDVAAALRHGAEHVDAVELDPVILRLGRQFHPEAPYQSPKVTAHVDDARAFLKKTPDKYDLVVFAFLDSTTLLSGFSSLRLDNYVYTVESFTNAKDVLSPGGTLVLSFATGRNFATDRLYASMAKAFGVAPAAYFTRYWVNGVLLVEGQARTAVIPGLPDASGELQSRQNVILATDHWPFLYLQGRSVPGSILIVSALFLLAAWLLLRRLGLLRGSRNQPSWHFFFLGTGFLLLETKAVTQMSLLFGSTWIVNAVVISAFLLMALVANAVIARFKIPRALSYGLLLFLLVADFWFPYALLNSADFWARVFLGGGWVALPVFFSGAIFSASLARLAHPAEMLGINLFGAVVGGVLENSVMLGGTPILGILAIGLYLISAAFLRPAYISSPT